MKKIKYIWELYITYQRAKRKQQQLKNERKKKALEERAEIRKLKEKGEW